MKMGLLSFSFKNIPLEIREKIKFTAKNYHQAYRLLKNSSFLDGTVILSTCNRTEIYFVQSGETGFTDFNECREFILEILIEIFNFIEIDKSELGKYLKFKEGSSAIEHLFQVASGLRSQVIGEEQILAQVKEALQIALEHQTSERNLNRLFQKAISTAKKVRNKTGISEKNLSISSICVNYIENLIPRLENKNILVIGVGKISRIVLELLQERGIEKIYATNRTHGKLVKIANYFDDLRIVDYDQLHQTAVKMDIIISSTAAPHYILKADKFKKYYSYKIKNDTEQLHKQINRKNVDNDSAVELCIFDLAVPRDVDPEIGKLAKISLYNIDDLDKELNRNQKYRLQEADKARDIIRRDIKEIESWLNWQEVVPVIKEIKRLNQKIINEEFEKLIAKIGIDDNINQEIISFADHLEKKLFNRIIINMKNMIDESDDEKIIDKFYDLLT